jgi:hypothetical protein
MFIYTCTHNNYNVINDKEQHFVLHHIEVYDIPIYLIDYLMSAFKKYVVDKESKFAFIILIFLHTMIVTSM